MEITKERLAKIEQIKTIPELFFDVAGDMDEAEALRFKEGGRWHSVSYREWAAAVRSLAAALADWIQPEQTACILSENRKEWTFADLATMSLGGFLAPIYPTSTPEDIAYIIHDAGARTLFVSTRGQLDRILALREAGEVDILEHIVVFDDVAVDDAMVVTIGSLLERGKGMDTAVVDERVAGLQEEQMATLIYTSGTTGQPKGVMLTHRNIMTNAHACFHRIGEDKFRQTLFLSFLPLSHSLERTCGYYMAIRVGGTIAYAESIDKLVENFAEVRPTVLISVPRIYEKIYATVQAKASSGFKKKVFDWAMGVGAAKAHAEAERQPVPLLTSLLYPIAFKLVFCKLHQRLGGRLEFASSGGAPLAREIEVFLKAAGLTVMQGYGLTETAPILTINGPDWVRFGSAGQPLEGIEIKIEPEPGLERPDEGEILARGPNIMLGYYNKEEATREVFTDDGWFRTGDIGYVDKDGFVFITDRKKELLKTSGGKYVAPAPIENRLTLSPLIEQACVIGNKRKFCTALIYLEPQALAEHMGWSVPKDDAEVAKMPEVKTALRDVVMAANEGLGRWETVKDFNILPVAMTTESGELTPSLKMKRRVIDERYEQLIDELYPKE